MWYFSAFILPILQFYEKLETVLHPGEYFYITLIFLTLNIFYFHTNIKIFPECNRREIISLNNVSVCGVWGSIKENQFSLLHYHIRSRRQVLSLYHCICCFHLKSQEQGNCLADININARKKVTSHFSRKLYLNEYVEEATLATKQTHGFPLRKASKQNSPDPRRD